MCWIARILTYASDISGNVFQTIRQKFMSCDCYANSRKTKATFRTCTSLSMFCNRKRNRDERLHERASERTNEETRSGVCQLNTQPNVVRGSLIEPEARRTEILVFANGISLRNSNERTLACARDPRLHNGHRSARRCNVYSIGSLRANSLARLYHRPPSVCTQAHV